MFSQTIVESNFNKKELLFVEHTQEYKFPSIHNHFLHDIHANTEKSLKILNLVSENKKVFITSGIGPYHIFFDNILPIMELSELDKDIEFIIDIINFKHNGNSIFIDFIKENIGKDVHITFVDSSEYDGIRINRCIVDPIAHHMPEQYISKYAKELIGVESVGTRKVYASMKKSFLKGSRIENEEALELFFSANGFEIVYPEDFDTIQNEINFFAQVGILVSLSSSALTWSMFMKPGSTVLELQTRFKSSETGTAVHHQYSAIANINCLHYYSITNYDKNSSSLIKNINDSKILTIL